LQCKDIGWHDPLSYISGCGEEVARNGCGSKMVAGLPDEARASVSL
jgi:hypothetical protein